MHRGKSATARNFCSTPAQQSRLTKKHLDCVSDTLPPPNTCHSAPLLGPGWHLASFQHSACFREASILLWVLLSARAGCDNRFVWSPYRDWPSLRPLPWNCSQCETAEVYPLARTSTSAFIHDQLSLCSASGVLKPVRTRRGASPDFFSATLLQPTSGTVDCLVRKSRPACSRRRCHAIWQTTVSSSLRMRPASGENSLPQQRIRSLTLRLRRPSFRDKPLFQQAARLTVRETQMWLKKHVAERTTYYPCGLTRTRS